MIYARPGHQRLGWRSDDHAPGPRAGIRRGAGLRRGPRIPCRRPRLRPHRGHPRARDAWKGRHGDALHWTGVSAWVVTGALQLALFFRYMYGWMPFTEYVRVLFTWNG